MIETLTVLTNQGEELTTDPQLTCQWDLENRLVTSGCRSCPLFVSRPEALELISQILQNSRDRNPNYPKKHMNTEAAVGICMAGQTEYGQDVRKVLVDILSPIGCRKPSLGKARERAEEKRALGLLKAVV